MYGNRGARVRGEANNQGVDRRRFVLIAKALADPTRAAMLAEISRRGRVSCGGLSGCGTVSQPTMSHHLATLRRAGLVRADRRGTCYELSVEHAALREFTRAVGGLARPARARRAST